MHPPPTVGRPPGQRGRKPGRRKTKVTALWNQKGPALGPQSLQPVKVLEPIKIPKKRGPKPGSKLGWAKRAGWLEDAMAGPGRPVTGPGRPVTGPGRTRGRLPANWAQRIALQTQAEEPVKIPKKRGPKPGSKRKPRVVPNPVPTSPTTSTPEPDTSTVPLDNATIPNSALQAPTVCVYLTSTAKRAPIWTLRRIQQLPDHFGGTGSSPASSWARGEVISAYFEKQQHTLTLPTVSSVTYVLRFLEKLCHNLHCDALFGSQPVARGGLHYDTHTHTAERRSFGDSLTTGPGRGTKRFLQDFNSPLPQKLPKTPRQSTDGESFMENSVGSSEHLKKSPLSPNSTVQTPGLRSPSKLLLHNNSTGSGSFRESPRPSGQDPNLWTVEEVMQYIREIDPVLAPHADLFRKHEIDGKALLLLRSDMMMKYMGLKLGPSLKLLFHIDKLKRG
ncbi:polycomb protein SCMH1-like [Notothenia coriiceps]|uniref:Polycomb protein SCMH1-like n=1 Tax=Notothenia coriiceps TaxID=8208 RepID=A0A6I9PG89_9TELE|nr:PREDICTED: polycomb protein SCMH1-like [Notothenia coriiceps]